MDIRKWKLGITAVLLLVLTPLAEAQAPVDDEQLVAATLNTLHQAASEADFNRYNGVFAANAVFLGTDATERWTRDQFMGYAKPYFDQGRGWTYVMVERHVSIAADGATAWFDERLDNASYGETRGSGVLIKESGEWKISQYNLTIPMPNDLAREFVDRIRREQQARDNEAVVLAMIAAVNGRDFDALDTLIAADVTRRSGATPGVFVTSLDEFKAFLHQDLAAVPDARQEVNAIFSGGGWVAVHATYRGTQDGQMGPFAPSGRAIELSFIGLLRVEDGLIREILVEWDNLAMLTQLGHWPPPGGEQ
ncbi:MAG: nuclear transport factor 2 family protein [Gemmatimonadetes bacterium]|nr:nuclear transport factor 2 family protein [Gemmatimonadota bacterium]